MRRSLRNLAWFVIGMALFLAIGQLAYGQELKDLKVGVRNDSSYLVIVRVQRFYPDDKEYPWHEVMGGEIQSGESFISSYKHPAGIFRAIINIPAVNYSTARIMRLGVPIEGATGMIVISDPEPSQNEREV